MTKHPDAILRIPDDVALIAIEENCRLHAEIQELREALKLMVENFSWGDMNAGEYGAIEYARAALAKHGGGK